MPRQIKVRVTIIEMISFRIFFSDDARKIANQVTQQFKVPWHELYNMLKFIRNKMDASSLNMNKDNAVDIIGKIYNNDYLNITVN